MASIPKSIDPALETAVDMLDARVCECGHLEEDHVPGSPDILGECADCSCLQFRPVAFTVTRAA